MDHHDCVYGRHVHQPARPEIVVYVTSEPSHSTNRQYIVEVGTGQPPARRVVDDRADPDAVTLAVIGGPPIDAAGHHRRSPICLTASCYR